MEHGQQERLKVPRLPLQGSSQIKEIETFRDNRKCRRFPQLFQVLLYRFHLQAFFLLSANRLIVVRGNFLF